MWHCTILLNLTFGSGFNTALIIYTVRLQHCSMLLWSGVQSESSGHLIFRSISYTEQRGILKSSRVIWHSGDCLEGPAWVTCIFIYSTLSHVCTAGQFVSMRGILSKSVNNLWTIFFLFFLCCWQIRNTLTV